VVRDADVAEPGLYELSEADPTMGFKVADLNKESIEFHFGRSEALGIETVYFDLKTGKVVPKEEADAKPEKHGTKRSRPILAAVGVPLWGAERDEIMEMVEVGVKEMNESVGREDKDGPIVKAIPRPGGPNKFLQSIVYHSTPWKGDWVSIIRQEVRQGVQSVLISGGTGLALQLFFGIHEQGLWPALAIVIPAQAVNIFWSSLTTLLRGTFGNYYQRAKEITKPLFLSRFVDERMPGPIKRFLQHPTFMRVTGSWVQQLWMSFVFGFTIFLAGGNHAADFFTKKLGSTLVNVWWRSPAENTLADFNTMEAKAGRGDEARAYSAKVRKITTIIATNFWVYSYLTKDSFGNFLWTDWNWGHVGTIAIGAIYYVLWTNPQLLKMHDAEVRKDLKFRAGVWAAGKFKNLWRHWLKFRPREWDSDADPMTIPFFYRTGTSPRRPD